MNRAANWLIFLFILLIPLFITKHVLSCTPSRGDINQDNVVDLVDFEYLRRDFYQTDTAQFKADIDCSGKVDLQDFYLWRNYYLYPQAITITPQISINNPPPPSGGIWISPARIANLPTTGKHWEELLSAADKPAQIPDIANQDDGANIIVYAQALVYARTGNKNYGDKVISALNIVCDPNKSYQGRALALGREVGAYYIAADLINLSSYNPTLHNQCVNKGRYYLTAATTSGPKTMKECYEMRPNNWGLHCLQSSLAIARYIGDNNLTQHIAQVFKGWVGDRSSYSNFKYGDLDWQCNPSTPVGINPPGCSKNGLNIDGVMPDDQRRCGKFSNPPCKTNYAWGALEGATATANMLYQAGFTDVFDWQNKALYRAVSWLYNVGDNRPTGDDIWTVAIIDYYYGSNFWDGNSTAKGKNVAFTGYTHKK